MDEALQEAHFCSSTTLGASKLIAESPWVVMKFGGTSVSSAESWETIASLIRNRLASGLRPVVVHSALAGVSNSLETVLRKAAVGEISEELDSIRRQHFDLAAALSVDGPKLLNETLQELEQLVAGVRLIREVSVRVHVRVMSLGELMATRLSAAYLESVGVPAKWIDARDVLTSVSNSGGQRAGSRRPRKRDYLAAVCEASPNVNLQERFENFGKVLVTQGFIARNEWGEPVLLGRGGSDTSAAIFAAKLQARRLEIWTDVPGMFTADPKVVPSARLLLSLHYDEAQELSSAGSTVLHPRCLSPLIAQKIPLFIRCTQAPSIAGTIISSVTDEVEPQVKGICLRSGSTLIALDGVGMWHEVGFLARMFSIFSEYGVSVDLISTSETNVTVSIDVDHELLGDVNQSGLIADLERLCSVRVIPDCSAVSLVGRKIRTILPRLAPALEVFEEEKIHLMSQAANDLNLSFVVDQGQGPKLVRKLHTSIIRKVGGSPAFGQSWERVFHDEKPGSEAQDTWWMQKRDQLLEIAAHQPNAYVYHKDSVRCAARRLRALSSLDRILYAVKANFNPELLQVMAEEGIDFECVSPGEVAWLEKIMPRLGTDRMLFTPNFASREEYTWAIQKGMQITLDNLYPLQEWPEIFAGVRLFIRIDPGQGRGHHEHVKTAGVHSKFGIPRFEVNELQQLIEGSGAEVVGIHAHSGSGILDPENWRLVALELVQVAQRFPSVEFIDLGGGIGVPEKPGELSFDLEKLNSMLTEIKESYPHYKLWLEPGRYLVAQAGVLLTHVTQIKGKHDMQYVGVSTGMNSLIRPALYGAYHEIVNLSKTDLPSTETVTVVGPICETGDRLGSDRLLPQSKENDVILIANAGAYGYVMSSKYNLREPAPEIVI
jgi:diaminopimelate decarboxylase/aspartate kinase